MSFSSELLSSAKGRFAETLIAGLLEHAGYRVVRLGVEEVISEVKAASARGERPLELPAQLRAAPDFLVIDPKSGTCDLLEVKFRRTFTPAVATELHQRLSFQASLWPGLVTAVVCADPPLDRPDDVRSHIGCLRESDLGRLVEPHDRLNSWQRMRTLGGPFPRVAEAPEFYSEAQCLIGPIRSWANPLT